LFSCVLLSINTQIYQISKEKFVKKTNKETVSNENKGFSIEMFETLTKETQEDIQKEILSSENLIFTHKNTIKSLKISPNEQFLSILTENSLEIHELSELIHQKINPIFHCEFLLKTLDFQWHSSSQYGNFTNNFSISS